MKKKIQIVIADDHQIVIDGLKVLLMTTQNMDIAGEANDTEQPYGILDKSKVDVLLLDLIIPYETCIDTIKRIKEKYPHVKILIDAGNTPERLIIQALETWAF